MFTVAGSGQFYWC
jgi:hypothetical protein